MYHPPSGVMVATGKKGESPRSKAILLSNLPPPVPTDLCEGPGATSGVCRCGRATSSKVCARTGHGSLLFITGVQGAVVNPAA